MQYKIEVNTNLVELTIYSRPMFKVKESYTVFRKGISTFFRWKETATFDTREEAECFIEEQE